MRTERTTDRNVCEEGGGTIICSQDECVDAPESKHIQKVPGHRTHPTTRPTTPPVKHSSEGS